MYSGFINPSGRGRVMGAIVCDRVRQERLCGLKLASVRDGMIGAFVCDRVRQGRQCGLELAAWPVAPLPDLRTFFTHANACVQSHAR